MSKPEALTYGSAELLLPYWKLEDFVLLKDLAEGTIRCDPYDLIKVMVLESDMDPHKRNPANPKEYPSAVGLNQISRIAAKEAGFIQSDGQWPSFAAEVLRMTVPMQLYLVARYFDAVPWGKTGKPYDATKLYQSNYLPYTLPGKTKPTDVLSVAGEKNYDGNKGLDIAPKDGKITVADLTAAIGGVPYAERTKGVYAAAVFMFKLANKLP